MFEVVVFAVLVGGAMAPDPCCLRVSPYHIQALAQRMSQRFHALEIRAQDLRNIFVAFQSVHGNVSTRLRFLETDHAYLHAEVLRMNTRLQVLEAEKRIEEYRQRLNLNDEWYNSYRGRRESELSSFGLNSTNRTVHGILQNKHTTLKDKDMASSKNIDRNIHSDLDTSYSVHRDPKFSNKSGLNSIYTSVPDILHNTREFSGDNNLKLGSDWNNPNRNYQETYKDELSINNRTSQDILRSERDVSTDALPKSNSTENLGITSDPISSTLQMFSSKVDINSSDSPFVLDLPIPESNIETENEKENHNQIESEYQGVLEFLAKESNTDVLGEKLDDLEMASESPLVLKLDVPELNREIVSEIQSVVQIANDTRDLQDLAEFENSTLETSGTLEVAPLPETNAPEISREVTETMLKANGSRDNLPASGECCKQNLTTSVDKSDREEVATSAAADLSDAELQEALRDLDHLLKSAPRDAPGAAEDPEKALLKRALALALDALDRTSDACLQLVNVTADAFGEFADL